METEEVVGLILLMALVALSVDVMMWFMAGT